jgi:hypothetical protein
VRPKGLEHAVEVAAAWVHEAAVHGAGGVPPMVPSPPLLGIRGRDVLAWQAGRYLATMLVTSMDSPVSFPVSVTFMPAYFWRSSRFWLSIWKTLPLLTKTYLLPLLMHASVQSLSEARSEWAARIFAWLTPHALSEIFPVHVAPKQDVDSKAVTKAILEIIWNTPSR